MAMPNYAAHQQAVQQSVNRSYGQNVSAASNQYNSILQGYQQLQSGVAQQLQGSDQAQKQFLADSYAQQRGQASQQMVNRGLGNTTVQNAVQRGLALDNAKAYTNVSNETAKMNAQYQAQIGLQGLGAQQQGNQFATSNATNIAQGNQRAGLQMAGLQLDAQKAAAQNQFQYAQLGQQGQIAKMNAGLQQQQMAYQYW